MNRKLVIFDLDGTLTNTLKSIQRACNLALADMGLSPFEIDRYRYFVGDGSDELVRRALRASGDEELIHFNAMRKSYGKHFAKYCMYEVKPYEGILELISELKKREILIAVNSNKPHEQTVEVIEDIFGKGTFDCIVGQSAERERKPAPDGVLYILEKLHLEKRDAIYIGDTCVDMQTGKSAGVLTIGALWGFRDWDELAENHADAIIEKPLQLINYVNQPEIRLVASDVDGTLVKDSSKEVYDEMITVVQELVDQGIHFAVASGRQYGSVRKMFAGTQRNISYIVENGAHIVVNGETVSITPMERGEVEEIMADLRALYPEGCHVVASTPDGSFLESKDEDFIRLITEEYRNDVRLTDDILKEPEEIIKLAVYKKGSIRSIGESVLLPKWKNRVKATLAGEEWVDFMDKTVDKGHALRFLEELLQIPFENTMAFGDNHNDTGMMQAAGESYAVYNAVKEVKQQAKYVCDDYTKHGVCKVLETLIHN